jgi:hypothetical protein
MAPIIQYGRHMSSRRITLLLAAAVLATTAAPAVPQGSILPAAGFYQGFDSYHNAVRFYYSSHLRKLENLEIAGEHFGSASVSGARWHHTCNGYRRDRCSRGHWTARHHVAGIWNDPNAGGDVHFNAVWKGNSVAP